MQTFLDLVLSDAGITALATALAVVLGIVLKVQKVRKIVVTVAGLAYDTVNAIKDQTPTKIDDKAAIALRIIRDHLQRDLSPAEEAIAKGVFDARHAQEKAAFALATKALSGSARTVVP